MTPDGGTNGPAGVQDVLRTEQVSLSFGPVAALRSVNLHLRRGEVLGLVGNNGAGKSTLVKILTGLYRPDGGRIYLEGEEVRFHSVQDARQHGIETVFQDLALVDELSVYHNLFLNREYTRGGRFRFLSNRAMRASARQFLDDIGVDIPSVDTPVAKLSAGRSAAGHRRRSRNRRQNIKVLLLDGAAGGNGCQGNVLDHSTDRQAIKEGEHLDYCHRSQLYTSLRNV